MAETDYPVSVNAGESEMQLRGRQGISGKVVYTTGDMEEKGRGSLAA